MFRRMTFVVIAALAIATPLAFCSQAGAAEPASGAVIPYALGDDPNSGPFDSGQTVNVVIPANTAFAAPNDTSGIIIVECAAPNGVVPTLPSACDGNTQQTFVGVNADGSFTFNQYRVFALPDSYSLGESASSPVTCGNTAATECMLYIGNNQNDFTQPHLWSEPFLIDADPTDSGTINPGDGTPEVPLAILLPLSAAGLLAGAVMVRRRRPAAS
jgi:hypothetical protein